MRIDTDFKPRAIRSCPFGPFRRDVPDFFKRAARAGWRGGAICSTGFAEDLRVTGGTGVAAEQAQQEFPLHSGYTRIPPAMPLHLLPSVSEGGPGEPQATPARKPLATMITKAWSRARSRAADKGETQVLSAIPCSGRQDASRRIPSGASTLERREHREARARRRCDPSSRHRTQDEGSA